MKTPFAILPEITKRLDELGYIQPTPIQTHAWKNLIEKHSDYVGQANTGSGKTIAYGVPLLQRLVGKENKIQALILVPTRELVKQTARTIFKLGKNLPKYYIEEIMGGEEIGLQKERLKRPTQIVVATPGRLVELINMKALNLENVRTVVLDEADELFAKGFKKEINKILSKTNDFRRLWLFSATVHGELNGWIKEVIDKDAPRTIIKTEKVMNPRIEHQYIECLKEDKLPMLLEFLSSQGKARGIIFMRTQSDVEGLVKKLKDQEIKTNGIFKDMPTKEREKVLRMFHNKDFQYLIATDIASRGIDFEDLAFVVHYQLPDDPDYYTHRSGRTARAGKRGISLSFVEPVERKKLRYIQDLLHVDFIQL